MKSAEALINSCITPQEENQMPLSRFKYTILEADTRPLEMFLGSFSIAWSFGLLMLNKGAAAGAFWAAVALYGGQIFWSTWACLNGLSQLNAIWFEKFKFRRISASSSAIYWIMATHCLAIIQPTMLILVVTILFAVGELWIVLRRAALGR